MSGPLEIALAALIAVVALILVVGFAFGLWVLIAIIRELGDEESDETGGAS